jgi:hypothetical protein
MTDEVRFRATLEAIPRGGHAVKVDPKRAAAIGAKHRTRVRGTFAGSPYHSNLASMGGGRLILGVHKATVQASGVSIGDAVSVTMRVDTEPLPSDAVPPELEERLRRSRRARVAWDALAPSHRREYAAHILGAKKPETRARRADAAIEQLLQ